MDSVGSGIQQACRQIDGLVECRNRLRSISGGVRMALAPGGYVADDECFLKLKPRVGSAGGNCGWECQTGHLLAASDERMLARFSTGLLTLSTNGKARYIGAIQPVELQLSQRRRLVRTPPHRRTDHDIDVERAEPRSEEASSGVAGSARRNAPRQCVKKLEINHAFVEHCKKLQQQLVTAASGRAGASVQRVGRLARGQGNTRTDLTSKPTDRQPRKDPRPGAWNPTPATR